MHLLDHNNKGKAVVLPATEIELLPEAAKDIRQRITVGLEARCGLRSHEITTIRTVDVIDDPAGSMLKVEHGKGEKYRETPLPRDLETTINVFSEQRDSPIDHPLVDVSTRAFREWTKQAADRCRASTGDDRWRHLSTHDLRRTWGNLLVEANVEHGQIMEWGGWENWGNIPREILEAVHAEPAATRVKEGSLVMSQRVSILVLPLGFQYCPSQ